MTSVYKGAYEMPLRAVGNSEALCWLQGEDIKTQSASEGMIM